MTTKMRISKNSFSKNVKNYLILSDNVEKMNEKYGMPMYSISFDYLKNEMKIINYFDVLNVKKQGYESKNQKYQKAKIKAITTSKISSASIK